MSDNNVFDKMDDEDIFNIFADDDEEKSQVMEEESQVMEEENQVLMEEKNLEDMDIDDPIVEDFYTELESNVLNDEFEESKFDSVAVEKSYKIDHYDVVAKRRYLIQQIENLVKEMVQSVLRGENPSLQFINGKVRSWTSGNTATLGSSGYCSDTETPVDFNGHTIKIIKFSGRKKRQRFALMTRVLAHAHENLVKNLNRLDNEFYCTKRAFFYRLKNEDIKKFVLKQVQVEWAITEVSMLLDCGPWDIGFFSTNKGIVAGDLSLQLNDSQIINYEQNAYHAVPDIVANVTAIRTTAEFVLVVEKDSVFQKLLHENCPAYNQCILITGKGYPDISTRMLVHLLSEKAKLPVYAIVDANPFGFEIMCVYRFGTLHSLGYREQLLCPKMRWLGVHYKDLLTLGINRVKLNQSDLKKIEDLRKRNYINCEFSRHLMDMKLGKAEIESINHKMERFLTKYFIPRKIAKKAYL